MASSTTKPTAMVSAMREMLSRLKLSKYMTENGPSNERRTDGERSREGLTCGAPPNRGAVDIRNDPVGEEVSRGDLIVGCKSKLCLGGCEVPLCRICGGISQRATNLCGGAPASRKFCRI